MPTTYPYCILAEAKTQSRVEQHCITKTLNEIILQKRKLGNAPKYKNKFGNVLRD